MSPRTRNPNPRSSPRKYFGAGEDPNRVDIGPLDHFVGYNLRQAQAAAFRDLARLSAPLQSSAGEYGLLVLIARNTGISSIEVSRFYGLAKSALTPVIAALLRRGLVHRTRTPRDRRVYSLSITERGRDALRHMQKAVDRQEANIAAALDPGERDRLIAMLRRITGALRAQTDDIGSAATNEPHRGSMRSRPQAHPPRRSRPRR